MYTEVLFENLNQETNDLLIANLQEMAEGFEEENHNLKVIFLQEHFNEEAIAEIASLYQLTYTQKEIAPENWNAMWESNFSPVIVDDFVGIRADFHEPVTNVQHEIIITPKMSFGTGHHATTHLMMQQMGKINFRNQSVFDFGTGTGVLAILAHKLGAQSVAANDIDDWSIENARENFERNGIHTIDLFKSDSGAANKNFDIILANINRNVLLDNMQILSDQLSNGGTLVLSGILEEDISAIVDCSSSNGLDLREKSAKNNWVCLLFEKTQFS